ncbi:MAG: nucleotide exchange factor GrpE [Gammaproteobacteria bacterium]|nr:nucleotide exchange factor GrpE [Gammaproteobacteria bacterium]
MSEPTDVPGGAPEPAAAAEANSPTTDTSENPLQAALAAAETQAAALKDQLLRAHAEMDNLRRRSQRDVENAHKFGVERLLGDMLPVLDSLEKGLESTTGLEGDAAKAVVEGLQLSHKLFLDTLVRFGLIPVDPHGEPFNPQRHEAIAMVPNKDMEPNSVMDVMQRGYVLHDRLLRAAKVIVTRAPG